MKRWKLGRDGLLILKIESLTVILSACHNQPEVRCNDENRLVCSEVFLATR